MESTNQITQEELDKILDSHENFLKDGSGLCADFTGKNIMHLLLKNRNLKKAIFSYTGCNGTVFDNCKLDYNYFYRSNLCLSEFRNCEINYSSFAMCDISNSKFSKCEVHNCQFGLSLFRQVSINDSKFTSNLLSGANVEGMYRFGLINFSGGSKGRLSVYDAETDLVHSGCFVGTLSAFAKAVKREYPPFSFRRETYLSEIRKVKKFRDAYFKKAFL